MSSEEIGLRQVCPATFIAKLPFATFACILLLYCEAPGNAAEIRGRVVDSTGAGIGDAVVFVQELPAGTPPAAAKPTAVMDQIQKEFVPHVLPIAVGTEVSFPNHDQIHHHVYSFSRPKTFEIPLYKGDPAQPVLFDRVGAVKVGCNIHDWMAGIILVVPTPYFTKSDASGFFSLTSIPEGTHSVAAWHERATSSVEDTAVEVDSESAPITFTLSLSAPRARPPVHGIRSYE